MNVFVSKNRAINALSIPLSCSAFIFIILSLLSLAIPLKSDVAVSFLLSTLCPAFLCQYYTKSHRLSFFASACIAMSNGLYYSFFSKPFGLGFIAFFSLVVIAAIKYFDLLYAFVIASLLCVLAPLLAYVARDRIAQLMITLATALSNKPTIFGAFNNAFTVLFGKSLSNMIFFKSYSGATFSNGEIVSGVVNAFLNSPDAPPKSTARFLTGNYYVNLFLPVGVIAALYSRIKSNFILPFLLCLVASLLIGDNTLFSLLLLFYNPFIYLGFLAVSLVSFFIPRLMSLAIGFKSTASVFSLIKYGNSWIYFILIGALLVVLMYFVCILVLSKYDLGSARYLPKEVKRLVDALGGDRNIIKIRDAKLFVANPNLIDVIKVDCDIRGNEITLVDNDLELLLDYFG